MNAKFGNFYATSVYKPNVVRAQQRAWAVRRKKMKTELKKISALFKKLKYINSSNLEAIKAAINTINLQKFTDEIINILSSGKITNQNVQDIVVVVGILHQQYLSFAPQITKSLKNRSIDDISNNGISTQEKMAVARLLCELYLQGIIWESCQIESILNSISDFGSTIAIDNAVELTTVTTSVVAFFTTCHTVILEAPILGQIENEDFSDNEIEANRVSGLSTLRSFLLKTSHRLFYNATRALEVLHERIWTQNSSNNNNAVHKDDLDIKKCKNIVLLAGESLLQFSKSLGISLPDNFKFKSRDAPRSVVEIGGSLDSRLPTLVRACLKNNLRKELTGYSQKEKRFYTLVKPVCVRRYFHSTTVTGANVYKNKQSNSSSLPGNFSKLLGSVFEIKEEQEIDYWMLNNGKYLMLVNRKLLVAKLIDFDQISMCNCRIHAKLVSIISCGIPEFGVAVIRYFVDILKGQKKQWSYERLMLISYFFAELCLFDICPVSIMIDILYMCLNDFRGVNVRICCYIIIKCGNYMCKSASSKTCIKSILDKMDRLLQVKALGYATKVLIEEAIFATRLPSNKYNPYRTDIMEEYVSFLLDFAPHSPRILSQKFAMLPWYFGKNNKNAVFIERLFLSKLGSTNWASKICEFLKQTLDKNRILQDRVIDHLYEAFEEIMFSRQTANFQNCQFLLATFKTCAKHGILDKYLLSQFLTHLMKEIEEEALSLAINGAFDPDLIVHRIFCLIGLVESVTEKNKAETPSVLHVAISTIQLRTSHLLDKHCVLNNVKRRVKYKIERCLI
jgi:hypothetical protein